MGNASFSSYNQVKLINFDLLTINVSVVSPNQQSNIDYCLIFIYISGGKKTPIMSQTVLRFAKTSKSAIKKCFWFPSAFGGQNLTYTGNQH